MTTVAMLNVRIDRGLKAEGDGVLSRAGISATEAIRSLYRYLERTQEVPECCMEDGVSLTAQQKRAAMRQLVGIAPLRPDETADTLRDERLSRYSF